MRKCRICKEPKPETDYCVTSSPRGRAVNCKDCRNERNRMLYAEKRANKFIQLSIQKWGLA